MSDSSYSAAICHLLLAGSSAVSIQLLRSSGGDYKWAYGALGLYFVKSCLGVVRFGFQERFQLEEIYDNVNFASIAVGLPCFATQLYLFHSVRWEYAIAHAAFSIIPVLAYITNTHQQDWLNLVLFGTEISLCGLGYVKENYFAIGAGVWHGVNTFILRDVDSFTEELSTLSLCVLNFIIVKSLATDLKIPGVS